MGTAMESCQAEMQGGERCVWDGSMHVKTALWAYRDVMHVSAGAVSHCHRPVGGRGIRAGTEVETTLLLYTTHTSTLL